MADEAQNMPLTGNDVQRFMRAKNAIGTCWVCGHAAGYDTFDEEALARRFTLFRFRFPDYPMDSAEASDIVLVECRNCHVIRIHNRQPIVDWAAENPESPGRHS